MRLYQLKGRLSVGVACFFVECMQRLAYNIVIEELLLMERKKVVGMQKMPTGVDNLRVLREKIIILSIRHILSRKS